jgi:hypothetical protein
MIILYVDKTVRGYRYGRGNIIELAPIEEALLIERGEAEAFSVAPDLSALLAKINNLADVPDPVAARESLGLGALAVLDAATFTTVSGAIRTIQARLLEDLSVKDLGAVGDGVTDDYAAFQAAHDLLSSVTSSVGGQIRIPPGVYYLSDTWKISKRVTIRGSNAGDQVTTGATRLLFAADKTGIRFYSLVESPTGTGGDYSRLEGVNMTAVSKAASGNGIWATCVVKVQYCVVRSFQGHGIYINGQTGTGATGIADAWEVRNTRIQSCGGDGLRVIGNDSNVGVAEMVETTLNGGYGYYDNASYCNTYIACQASGNVAGAYYNRNGVGLGGVYIGCYTESGGLSNFDPSVLVLGGVMNAFTGQFIYPGSTGLTLNAATGSRHIFARAGVEIARIETTNKLTGLAGAKWSGGVTDYTDMGANLFAFVTSVTSSQDRMRFDNPNGRVGSISTNASATVYSTSSDVRMKENVVDAPDAGADIDAVRVVSFNWKSTGELQKYGVIAQELIQAFPGAVSAGDEGEEVDQAWGVDYSKLVPMLVKEIQDLRARVQSIEAGT